MASDDYELEYREVKTVLAALLYWQHMLSMGGPPYELMVGSKEKAEHLTAIANAGGAMLPLTYDEIEDLYERLDIYV